MKNLKKFDQNTGEKFEVFQSEYMGNLKNIDQNTGKKVSIRILVQLYDPALLVKFRSEKY